MPFIHLCIQKMLQVIVILACGNLAEAAVKGPDAGRGAIAVEIGAKDLTIHHTPGLDRSQIRHETGPDSGASAVQLEETSASSVSQDGSFPYFVGSWSGQRNNWYGDVGYAFVPQKDFTILSLGRHHHNSTGLTMTVPVTLWSVEDKAPLAICNVGHSSPKEGHYRWEPVDPPGVAVKAGREYRITQQCTPMMEDKWYDLQVSELEIESMAATGLARFIGGVNQSGPGYPENADGQFRRPGMVNFKLKEEPMVLPGSPEGGARHGHEIQAAIVALSFWSML